MTHPPRLLKLRVAGFRSLGDVTLHPGSVTLLIGPNGAGKSNLLWALELVRFLAHGSLQLFVGERGGASFLLHYGPKVTPHIDLLLEFENTDASGQNAYEARLGHAADESLVFLSERAGHRRSASDPWRWGTDLGTGHRETRLLSASTSDKTVETVLWLLRHLNFYHFHDTSFRSPLRTRPFEQTSGSYLRSDGSNLPVFLLGLKQSTGPGAQAAWRRIEGTLQRLAPFVRSLDPVEDRRGVQLEWQNERGQSFGPAHLSDGTLRALALIAALGQPEAGMPFLSCIDEPELGLHPAAIEMLCGLVSSVGARRQVIVSTQSPALLDHFGPEDVVVAERSDGATVLRRLDPAALSVWLEEYSLSQLYDKNVLGGRP